MLTKVLLLQFYENVSDRQAEERALYDLRWKVALHLQHAIEKQELDQKEQQLKEMLSKIVEQDIQRQEDGTVIIKQGVAKDRIISTSDPEMRHGHKSSSRRFDGYKTHTAMEEESEFVTAVEVTPGNTHDSEATTKLIDAQPKEQQPETVMGDTAYGTS